MDINLRQWLANLTFCFIGTCGANYESPYYASLMVDPDFSPLSGYSLIQDGLFLYQGIDNHFFNSTTGDQSLGAFGLRTAKALLIDGFIASQFRVIQHEVFGHGFRGRDQKLGIQEYGLQAFKGSTSFDEHAYQRLKPPLRAAIQAGGYEASSILADRQRMYFLHHQKIDAREGMLYAFALLDLMDFALKVTNQGTYGSQEHDVLNYAAEINHWQGSNTFLTANRLRRRLLLNLADPFLWASLWTIGHYIYTGEATHELPVLDFNGWDYLPTFQMQLAPYGTEFELNNYFYDSIHQFRFGFRAGSHRGFFSWGINLTGTTHAFRYDAHQFILEGDLGFWYQPDFFTDTARDRITDKQVEENIGFGGLITLRYLFSDTINVAASVGMKTKGFWPNEPLAEKILGRIAIYYRI